MKIRNVDFNAFHATGLSISAELFGCFQGVYKETSGMKRVKDPTYSVELLGDGCGTHYQKRLSCLTL